MTPIDEAVSKAAAEALTTGSQGFRNCRVLFAYRDAYSAAYDAARGKQAAIPDQTAAIAARAVARAVSQQIASEESSAGNAAVDHNPAESDINRSPARDPYSAAYDASYKAVYRSLDADSKAPEYDHCVVAYEAAKNQLIQAHLKWDPHLVEELATKALFAAAGDRAAKQSHVPR
ncbi:MAG TPA: hypothetical protein VFE24_09270 [Pirellulales bacterium]|nr:hypothetical protein [Pirellulales bacterium]